MKRWLMLILVVTALTSVLTATTIKVAVLPLKRTDSASKYIQKFLTIRDLQHTFDTNQNYALMDMKQTAATFKEQDIEDIDEMDKPDMAAIGKELGADVLVMGTINSIDQNTFSILFRIYSVRTDDLKTIKVAVEKEKRKRWDVLEKNFLAKLDSVISEELDKIGVMAVQDFQSEDYVNSEMKFNSVLSFNPNDKNAYYYLGLIAQKQKNYDKAISNLTRAMPDTLSIKSVKILQAMVNVYEEAKNTAMLLTTLEQMANLQNDEELWLSIANRYVDNNQKNKAKTALEQALKINPDYMKGTVRMAFLLYDNEQYREAIPYLEKAANDNPDNDLYAKRLAFSYQKSGMIAEAIARYEKIVSSDPTNKKAYLNLAGLYRAAATEASDAAVIADMNQKALQTLNRLKSVDPNDATMFIRLADTYLAMNMITEAEGASNTALSKDSNLYQPFIILATINQRRGTEKYNQFVDLEKAFLKAFGQTANRLDKERKAAKAAANGFFRKADEQLRAAKARTNEPEVISDINSKISVLSQLIEQTSK